MYLSKYMVFIDIIGVAHNIEPLKHVNTPRGDITYLCFEMYDGILVNDCRLLFSCTVYNFKLLLVKLLKILILMDYNKVIKVIIWDKVIDIFVHLVDGDFDNPPIDVITTMRPRIFHGNTSFNKHI